MSQFKVGFAIQIGVHIDTNVGEKRLRHDPRPVHGDAKKQGSLIQTSQLRPIGRRSHRTQILRRPLAIAVTARWTLIAKLKHRHQRGAVRIVTDYGQHDRCYALRLPNHHATDFHAMISHRPQQHVVRHMHRVRLAVKPNLTRRLVGDMPRAALHLRCRGGIEHQLHLGRVDGQRQFDRGFALGRDGDRRLGRSECHAGVGQGVAHRDGAGPRLALKVCQLDVALGQVRPGDFQ